jgi:ribulose-phosphate 3-epimerase
VAGSAVFKARNEADPHRYDSVLRDFRAQLAGVR